MFSPTVYVNLPAFEDLLCDIDVWRSERVYTLEGSTAASQATANNAQATTAVSNSHLGSPLHRSSRVESRQRTAAMEEAMRSQTNPHTDFETCTFSFAATDFAASSDISPSLAVTEDSVVTSGQKEVELVLDDYSLAAGLMSYLADCLHVGQVPRFMSIQPYPSSSVSLQSAAPSATNCLGNNTTLSSSSTAPVAHVDPTGLGPGTTSSIRPSVTTEKSGDIGLPATAKGAQLAKRSVTRSHSLRSASSLDSTGILSALVDLFKPLSVLFEKTVILLMDATTSLSDAEISLRRKLLCQQRSQATASSPTDSTILLLPASPDKSRPAVSLPRRSVSMRDSAYCSTFFPTFTTGVTPSSAALMTSAAAANGSFDSACSGLPSLTPTSAADPTDRLALYNNGLRLIYALCSGQPKSKYLLR
ncbi:unnamed protein product [Protopolystoma xenopodis]|uniref:Uncharacterized protein n=1 Tax=Protopolystoma xenopodis TaxID=117903 RepID=A0A3S5B205_9PLAT|nr:unnamed protein product [Protopolystoma xenopodis]